MHSGDQFVAPGQVRNGLLSRMVTPNIVLRAPMSLALVLLSYTLAGCDDPRADCAKVQDNPALSIQACSKVINTGGETRHNLAMAFFNRGAAFNNLGYPTYSTVFNWGRSTLGVIPFAWAGGHYFGAEGVLAGRGLGAVIFGIASMVVCFRTVADIARGQDSAEEAVPALPPAANSPDTNSCGRAA